MCREVKMNNINELLSTLNEKEKLKFENFIALLDDMQLGEEFKMHGGIYFLHVCGKISLEDVQNKFSTSICTINTLNKLNKINFSQQNEEAENLRKMFFAITKDIRIIMLRIALVVVELRFSENLNAKNKVALANSIFTLYAPLSARLGLSNIKTELENGAFKILQPEKYASIEQEVDTRFHSRQPVLEKLITLVQKSMTELGIKGKVYGRKKHIYSIYKKLADHTFDDIYDLVAVRAIVNNVSQCYALLGKLHMEVEPFQKRFKDYIATPKPNGYQSLHTTVLFEDFPVEIQIRTKEMHDYAEYGVAAHWIYKEKRAKQDTLDIQLAWLRQMMENEKVSIEDLAKSLNQDIYNNEIFVQTPKGKVIYLPNGSTPIDFAYAIHGEIGNKCVGAKVNGKMQATDSALANGDVVEIITNPNSKGPSRDWLKICKTSSAKAKINAFFKKNMKEENIKLGKTMLENALKEKGFSISKLMSNSNVEELLKYYNLNEVDEFYNIIGTNAVSAKNIANRLALNYQKQIVEQEILPAQKNEVSLTPPTENQVAIKDLNNILIKFAGCCHPMKGDDIIGFVSAGRGIIIHRSICPNVSYFHHSRLIEASWKPVKEKPKRTKKNA